MYSYEKIARILRTDKDTIRILDDKLSVITGKKNLIEKIAGENELIIENRLECLGLDHRATAKQIYDALIKKIEADDLSLYKSLGQPKATSPQDWEKVLKTAEKLFGSPEGFFLKKEKAIEFLKNQPPLKIIKFFGYKTVDDLIRNENLLEIFSSLRFVEGSDWLNNVFFKQYASLKPEDFEKRKITTLALSKKWAGLDESFIRKKHHNISHLKEMGIIYVLPLSLEISGETLRNLSLILHYFNEVPFYSKLFEFFAKNRETFAQNVVSLLRGDIIDYHLPQSRKIKWLIVQRYLAKDDENDWRLREPHINPEPLHWERAEDMLIRAGGALDNFSIDLSFWKNLNWVGDYFKTDTGIEVLVSFNLVDTAMSLVKAKELLKYYYHHQEALWNKIFTEYFGEEKMEELIKENIIKGWFEV